MSAPRRDPPGGGYPPIAMSRPSAVKNRRTTVPLAALLALCTVVLVACGSSKSPSTSVASNPSTSTSASGGATTATTTTGSTGTKAAGSTQSKQTGTGHSSTTSSGGGSAGKSSTASAPPAPTSTETSSVKQCLERNGIKSHASGKAPTRAQLNAALAHCVAPLRPRTSNQTSVVRRRLLAQPSYRQALARFTSCMRTHGVPNFPAANTTGKGPLYPAGSVKPTPQVREAQKACIGELRLR